MNSRAQRQNSQGKFARKIPEWAPEERVAKGRAGAEGWMQAGPNASRGLVLTVPSVGSWHIRLGRPLLPLKVREPCKLKRGNGLVEFGSA